MRSPRPRAAACASRAGPGLAVADEIQLRAGQVGLGDDQAPGVDQALDAVLRAHHPDVADAPGLGRDARRQRPVGGHVRGVADHDHALVGHATASPGDGRVRVVGRDDQGRRPVRGALHGQGEPMEQAALDRALTELGPAELRVGVVLVEDVGAAAGPGQPAEDPEQVRWVAAVDDRDGSAAQPRPGQPAGGQGHRGQVLGEVAGQPRRRPLRVAQDLHAVDGVAPAAHAAGAARADDGHLPAVVGQRPGFLPGAPVERDGEILDEDDDAGEARRRVAHAIVAVPTVS